MNQINVLCRINTIQHRFQMAIQIGISIGHLYSSTLTLLIKRMSPFTLETVCYDKLHKSFVHTTHVIISNDKTYLRYYMRSDMFRHPDQQHQFVICL